MRKAALTTCLFCFALAAFEMLSVSAAHAFKWTICNSSAYKVDVAIVFPRTDGFTSKGWWTLRACGGCAVVLNRPLPATGVFLRGESESGAVYAGQQLFCTARSAFEITRAHDSRQHCERRRGQFVSFGMHILKSQNHTTTLRRPAGANRVCFD